MKILVVPTIREQSIKFFLREWHPVKDWDAIIVVEDNPEKTFDVDVTHHYSWKEIDEELGNDSWIISRRDSAIRSFGFYKAKILGAKYIFTLDDDCLPNGNEKFCESHIKNLEETSRWAETIPNFRTRGIPYRNFGILNNVAFSMGLWSGIPDVDAIHMLAGHGEFELPKTRVMPYGQYFPFSGMNFAFKADFTPLAYFPIMGKDSPFGRFDDIWFGVICKKICDHLNLTITCGEPYIFHNKASDMFENLVKEAPSIKKNEIFWQQIDEIPLTKRNPVDCIVELGEGLKSLTDDEYMSRLGEAIQIWAKLSA